jgi:transposase
VTIIGLDPHPTSHTAAALDLNGLCLGLKTVENTKAGLEALHHWAEGWPERTWAIEGASNPFILEFVHDTLERGERVVNIAANLTSQYRSRRGAKKTDVLDAQNAARVLIANPNLPTFETSDDLEQIKRLTRTRDHFRTQVQQNRGLCQHLPLESLAWRMVAEVVAALEAALEVMDQAIEDLVRALNPDLLGVRGVGVVVAGVILAEVGNISRFPDEDHFASYCGCAPVVRSSGRTRRVVVNRGGNRRLNWAVHIVALSRLRCCARSKAFVARKRGEGLSSRAALRGLKTVVAREVFRFLVGSARAGDDSKA